MTDGSFSEVLKAWENSTVTIINPESYSISRLSEGITFESYEVNLVTVTGDYIKINYATKKADQEEAVDQYIPLGMIKRVSIWGGQKFIQI